MNKNITFRGAGAHVAAGQGAASAIQQTTAQKGRQNIDCANPNGTRDNVPLPAAGGNRITSSCTDQDGSWNESELTEAGGAETAGGSTMFFQQNAGQEGRQNVHCANPNGTPSLTGLGGSGIDSGCINQDLSRNRSDLTRGSGARAFGGDSPGTGAGNLLFQQQIAQEGRQNLNCTNVHDGQPPFALGASQVASRCANKDASHNKETAYLSRGADAVGGSGVGITSQQNTAQEGRQNLSCTNPNSAGPVLLTGSRVDSRCKNQDVSTNGRAVFRGDGAHAEGGSGTDQVQQQNTAQEGRQNLNCSNPSDVSFALTGSRIASACANQDASRNKHTVATGRGARAFGGSAGAFMAQQNNAQEGRQNTACAGANGPDISRVFVLNGSTIQTHCSTADHSRKGHAVFHGGGARALGGNGGSATASVFQQNTAQEGWQNLNCANPNATSFSLTASTARTKCATVDRSVTVGTVELSGGSRAVGGNSVATLEQQNIAQDGRQHNNCANPNSSPLAASGARTTNTCVAVDTSHNIGTVTR
ncbi:hypothetical protein [Streptomyces sp. NPDC051776]|uniref:hypothetical protein n=1 Tax=Streptomyces sp. NPDC051776 TaxID=3155414 RepID=UPI003430E999